MERPYYQYIQEINSLRPNIIEILSLFKANVLIEDERCNDAVQILKRKQRPDGFWQADTSYMKSAWIDFDIPKKLGLWITYIISGLVRINKSAFLFYLFLFSFLE